MDQLTSECSSDSGKQKKAVVQWFVRMCEIPQNKRKLLGRDAHPQEIFYYQDRSCDNEVDAQTILGTVQVCVCVCENFKKNQLRLLMEKICRRLLAVNPNRGISNIVCLSSRFVFPFQIRHVPAEAPFPDDKSKNTLFVKLQWDTKNFQVLDPELMKPPQSPKSPPPAWHAPRLRALPTPDPSVMKRAMSGVNTRGSMSTGKMGSTGAESAHSASKLSAAKLLNVKRRGRVSSNPNIRKKLDLCSECCRVS